MNKQLELFPEIAWKEYKYCGKLYKRYINGNLSYKKIQELRMNVENFIDEYKNY